MGEYNIKVSKLEDGSYKLKINNYSRYEVEEVEALAIKYLQNKLQQEENIKKEAIKYIESYMPNYDFDKTNLIKLLEILDKGE